MKNYKRLLTYMRPYVKKFALAVVCIILASAANLYVPWIIKDMIDDVLADKNMALLNAICIGIVVIFFLRGIFYFGQSYLVSYIGQKVIIDVREVMFRKFQRMPLAYYDRHQTGEIMSFVTNDVAAIQSALVDNLIDLVTEGCILIGSLALMFYLDWKLSLLTLIVIPMVGQAMKIFGRKIKKSSTVIQERLAEITALLQESFSATRVVKSFVREDYEIDRFVASNQRNFEAVMKNVQQTSMLTPTVEFLAALAVTFIVWFGGYEVVNGDITAGAFVAFLTYAVNLANPVKRLSRIYGNLQKAMAAVDRVFSVVDLTESITDRPDAKPLPPVTGRVRFENVTFSYKEGRKALDGVTLEAAPGEMISRASMSRTAEQSQWTDTISAVSHSPHCADRSGWYHRRRCCSPRQFARTSAMDASMRRMRRSRRRRVRQTHTISSRSWSTATIRRSGSAASASRAVSASALPSRAPF